MTLSSLSELTWFIPGKSCSCLPELVSQLSLTEAETIVPTLSPSPDSQHPGLCRCQPVQVWEEPG